MTRPFSSQDERDAFRESLPASDMLFVVPTSEVRMLLDALDAAERRAAEAEAEANGYAQAIDRVLVELATLKRAIPGSGIILATFEVGLQALSRGAKERALALASVATGGQGGEGT